MRWCNELIVFGMVKKGKNEHHNDVIMYADNIFEVRLQWKFCNILMEVISFDKVFGIEN